MVPGGGRGRTLGPFWLSRPEREVKPKRRKIKLFHTVRTSSLPSVSIITHTLTSIRQVSSSLTEIGRNRLRLRKSTRTGAYFTSRLSHHHLGQRRGVARWLLAWTWTADRTRIGGTAGRRRVAARRRNLLEEKTYGGGVHRDAWKRRTPNGGNVFWKSGRELIDGHTHVRYWRASGQRSPGLSFSYAHHNVFPAR